MTRRLHSVQKLLNKIKSCQDLPKLPFESALETLNKDCNEHTSTSIKFIHNSFPTTNILCTKVSKYRTVYIFYLFYLLAGRNKSKSVTIAAWTAGPLEKRLLLSFNSKVRSSFWILELLSILAQWVFECQWQKYLVTLQHYLTFEIFHIWPKLKVTNCIQ